MIIKQNKYLILRRLAQALILILFLGSSHLGWSFLKGNYSTAEVSGLFYLSDPYAIMQILFSGYFPRKDIIIGAIIIMFFYFLTRGRIFCSWVCPLNIITDTASFLRKKLSIKPLVNSNQLNRKIRFYVLSLGLVLSSIFGLSAFETISPISMLHRGLIFNSLSGLIVVFLVFLFDIFIIKYGWCGYLCPVGAFYSILGHKGLIKIFHTKENCTNCMKCKIVCPEVEVLDKIGIISGSVNKSACTDCGRCIDVCNDNSLNFKITVK